MPVPDSAALNELIRSSEEAREAAAQAIARSVALQPFINEVHEQSLMRRMASRTQKAFVHLRGVVDGAEVAALVRTDASVVGTPSLLRRAGLLVAMGERFDLGHTGAGQLGTNHIEASVGKDPVATALTLIRACDWVSGLELMTQAARRLGDWAAA